MVTLSQPLDYFPTEQVEKIDCDSMSTQDLFDYLIKTGLIRSRLWRDLPDNELRRLASICDESELLCALEERKLLTPYQVTRIQNRRVYGMVLGNYRILDRIGVGGMGVVYKAEHIRLPRVVAIKVLTTSAMEQSTVLDRFLLEMEAIAQLQHSNIVSATDAGVVQGNHGNEANLHYFVMDYVPGASLEEMVRAEGALEPLQACDIIYQVASALAEAHRHGLIHRDIKPSNILVTPEGQAKLLDFGLARHHTSSLTEPGMVLGTVDYLPPEQAEDAHEVDHRADFFGLGATFYWCLTGKEPFPSRGNLVMDLAARSSQPPPSVRDSAPSVSADLDAVVAKMMALKPDDRFSNSDSLMQALLPFLRPEAETAITPNKHRLGRGLSPHGLKEGIKQPQGSAARIKRVLVVDDDPGIRQMCHLALQSHAFYCDQAANGQAGWEALESHPFDLVLLDVDMPEVTGLDLLDRIRETPPCSNFKVIMFSGRASPDEMSRLLSAGADDYLTKPLSLTQLLSRVKSALRLKDAQDRSERLTQELLQVNQQLEESLSAKDSDLVQARNALVLALAEMVSFRDSQTGSHLLRMQLFCRALGRAASLTTELGSTIDEGFLSLLENCAPLHDIGKMGLPDHILLKPGKLEPDERIIMQTHTTIGADTLQKVADRHGFSSGFFQMAIDIARHHHERFDGNGYPDGLYGEEIPLAARIVAIADTYDALRSRRSYKTALSHPVVLQMMMKASEGHFDPVLLEALANCASEFERIYRENPD